MAGNDKRGSSRGPASIDKQKRRAIASEGSKAAHETGNAYEPSADEARDMGRNRGKAVSKDKEHMAEIGAKNGPQSHKGD